MNRGFKTLSWTLVLIGTGALGFWLGHDARTSVPVAPAEAAADTQNALPVKTVPIRDGTITQFAQAYGIVQANPGATVSVAPLFEARIEHLLVRVGSRVTPGSPLAAIAPSPDAALQLQQAKDALAAASRAQSQAETRLSEHLATNADVAAAEQAERTAKTQWENLTQRGVGTTTQLTAPVEGMVTQLSGQTGQTVPAGTPVVMIAPTQALEAVIGVDPLLAATLQPGTKVELRAVGDANAAAPPSTVATIRAVIRSTHRRACATCRSICRTMKVWWPEHLSWRKFRQKPLTD